MEVDLRGTHRGVAEQFGDLIEGAAGVGDVAGEGVPELVRLDPSSQTSPAARGGQQLAQPVRCHRGTDRRSEQVDEHEPAVTRAGHPEPLELVGIEGLHHQEVQRHHPLPAGLRPRVVRVVAAYDMQVRSWHLAAQQTGSPPADGRRRDAVRRPHLGAPRRGPSAARSADPALSGSLVAAGTISTSSARSDDRLRLVQPVPGPHPPRHPGVFASRLGGEVPVVSKLIDQREQPPWCRPGRHRVHDQATDRGQDPVDPPCSSHRGSTRPVSTSSGVHIQTRSPPAAHAAARSRTGQGVPRPSCHAGRSRRHQRKYNAMPPA